MESISSILDMAMPFTILPQTYQPAQLIFSFPLSFVEYTWFFRCSIQFLQVEAFGSGIKFPQFLIRQRTCISCISLTFLFLTQTTPCLIFSDWLGPFNHSHINSIELTEENYNLQKTLCRYLLNCSTNSATSFSWFFTRFCHSFTLYSHVLFNYLPHCFHIFKVGSSNLHKVVESWLSLV